MGCIIYTDILQSIRSQCDNIGSKYITIIATNQTVMGLHIFSGAQTIQCNKIMKIDKKLGLSSHMAIHISEKIFTYMGQTSACKLILLFYM